MHRYTRKVAKVWAAISMMIAYCSYPFISPDNVAVPAFEALM
jgi:hypothetical protein